MVSRQLPTTEAARAQRAVAAVLAAEIAARFEGWHVFSSRDGKARLATRTGNQRAPERDGVWAATLMADNWEDLVRQLTEQAQHDLVLEAERTA